ncbi:DUF6221 family protein [Streptomyces sp. NPDC055722]
MIADLVAFLRARLDEDDRAARAATPGPWTTRNLGRHDGSSIVADTGKRTRLGLPVGPVLGAMHGPCGAADGSHAARHDPARVLRQTAILRDRVDLWSKMLGSHAPACLRAVAAIWADHPDYREEWTL